MASEAGGAGQCRCRPAARAFQQAAQHPRGLFVDLDALGQQVGGRLVADLVHQREDAARGAHHGFLPLYQQLDHVLRVRHAFLFLDRGQAGVGGVGARRREAQGADALGDQVYRQGQFGRYPCASNIRCRVLNIGPGDVPVEVVGLQVQGVGVRQQAGQAFGDGCAVLFGDADIDLHGVLLLLCSLTSRA